MNLQQLEILKSGVESWNNWRRANKDIIVDLQECNFKEINFNKSQESIDLSKCILIKANFADCKGININFSESDLQFTNFKNSSFEYCNFTKTDLNEANFQGSYCTGSNFSQSNLFNANFSGSSLFKVNLYKTRCEQTNFSKANLSHAELFQTKFLRTDFSGSDLSGTICEHISFNNCNLRNALYHSVPCTKTPIQIYIDNILVVILDNHMEIENKIFSFKNWENITVDDLEDYEVLRDFWFRFRSLLLAICKKSGRYLDAENS